MANTIDADLLIDVLSNAVINTLPEKLAPLNAYTTDFSESFIPATKSVQVMKVTSGSTTVMNPTSYESGNTATTNVAVTPNVYTQAFHLTSTQINQKLSLEKLATANLNALAATLVGVPTALMLAATFTGTGATVAQASFAASHAKSLRGQIGKVSSKNLILDSIAYAQLAPENKNAFDLGQSGGWGFDRIIEQSLWTGATANVYGVACGPEAIAIAAGIPEMSDAVRASMIGQRVVQVPGLGLSVQVNVWCNTASRITWCSYDVLFGAAVADSSALVLIKSA